MLPDTQSALPCVSCEWYFGSSLSLLSNMHKFRASCANYIAKRELNSYMQPKPQPRPQILLLHVSIVMVHKIYVQITFVRNVYDVHGVYPLYNECRPIQGRCALNVSWLDGSRMNAPQHMMTIRRWRAHIFSYKYGSCMCVYVCFSSFLLLHRLVAFACNNRIFLSFVKYFFPFFISTLFLCSVCLSVLFVVFVSVAVCVASARTHLLAGWLDGCWLPLSLSLLCIKYSVYFFGRNMQNNNNNNNHNNIERTKWKMHENKGEVRCRN